MYHEEEALGQQIGEQDAWVQIGGMKQNNNDAYIPDDLAPAYNLDVNWVQTRVTNQNQFERASLHLNQMRSVDYKIMGWILICQC